MLRNTFAIIGFLALISYFKPQIIKVAPVLAVIPFPQITIEGQKKEPEKPNLIDPADKESTNNPTGTAQDKAPAPAPSPKDKKWGIHFELKSNIGEQSGQE